MTTYTVRFLKLSLVLLSVFSLNAESTTKSAKIITKSFDHLKDCSPDERSLILSNLFRIPQEPIKEADKFIKDYEHGLINDDDYIRKLKEIYDESKKIDNKSKIKDFDKFPLVAHTFVSAIKQISKCYTSPSKTLGILDLIENRLNTYERKPLYQKPHANVSLKSKSFLPSISKTCSLKKAIKNKAVITRNTTKTYLRVKKDRCY